MLWTVNACCITILAQSGCTATSQSSLAQGTLLMTVVGIRRCDADTHIPIFSPRHDNPLLPRKIHTSKLIRMTHGTLPASVTLLLA